MNQINQTCAVVLAAGKGTRMKSDLPKVATLLNEKPLLLHVVETLESIGISRILVIIGYKKEIVMDLLKNKKGIEFAEQKEQLGTGHAVLCAEDALKDFEGNLLVCCGDVPLIRSHSFQELLDYHSENQMNATVLSAKIENPKGYGRLVFQTSGKLDRIVEEKDASDEEKKIDIINTGTYVFSAPSVFSKLKSINSQNAQNEYYLPDLIGIYNQGNGKTGTVVLKNHLESLGVNSPEDLLYLHDILEKGQV
ncbi:MAG: NTP transferase domain-containing protein [Leptospiraceae bacterium]|nr:NTP transferase domain-containing protein [Leptospiraceae bacterium]MCP5510252.1 NTP transferase domain-containing protein [Leptospiraceae bacterium]